MRTLPRTVDGALRRADGRRRWALHAVILGLLVTLLTLAGPLSPAGASGNSPAEAPTASNTTPPGTSPARSLVVIGASGLSLTHIDPEVTPHLHAFTEQAAMANLSVRSLTAATCPAAGWLTLGAGSRAGAVDLPGPEDEADDPPAPPPGPAGRPEVAPEPEETATPEEQPMNYVRVPPQPAAACPEIRTPESTGQNVWIPEFERIAEVNSASGYTAELGTMAQAVRDAGECTQAIGAGAGYAGASPEGRIEQWMPGGQQIGDCTLTLVDVGALGLPGWIPEQSFDDAAAQLTRADRRIGEYLAQVDPATTDVVIAGVGDTSSPSRLRALLAAGPSYSPGIITSTSTRQTGTAQLSDLATAALTRVEGMPAPAGASRAAFVIEAGPESAADRLTALQADAAEAATVHSHASTFSIFLDVVHYLLFAALGILLFAGLHARLRARGSARVHRGLGWAGLVIAVIPMGSFLAGVLPWARFPSPELGLWLAVAAGSAALLVVALVGPWRRTFTGRVTAVCITSAVVLAADIALGSQLQFNSLMGYNPIVAGRFYGLGNQGAALFIVAVFLGLTLALRRLVRTRRRLTAALVVVTGLVSVAILGNPAWGAKFGGTIATLAGFLVLLALVLGIRLNVWRLALIGAVSLISILGVAGLDYLRPPAQRSHFGGFFAQLLDGELFTVIERKLQANLSIVESNPALAMVVPLSVVAVLLFLSYLARFRSTATLTWPWVGRLPAVTADPMVHAGFLAVTVGLAVGLIITDSGIAVPAIGAMMFVPLLMALSADTVPHIQAAPHTTRASEAVPRARASEAEAAGDLRTLPGAKAEPEAVPGQVRTPAAASVPNATTPAGGRS